MDYHLLSSYTIFNCNLNNLQFRLSIETKGLIRKQTTLHMLHTFAVGRHFNNQEPKAFIMNSLPLMPRQNKSEVRLRPA